MAVVTGKTTGLIVSMGGWPVFVGQNRSEDAKAMRMAYRTEHRLKEGGRNTMNRRSFVGTFVGACVGVVAGAWAGVTKADPSAAAKELLRRRKLRLEYAEVRIRKESEVSPGDAPGYFLRVSQETVTGPRTRLENPLDTFNMSLSREGFCRVLRGWGVQPNRAGEWWAKVLCEKTTEDGTVIKTIGSWARDKGMPA